MSSLTHNPRPDPLGPLRHWIDNIAIERRWAAHLVCRIIPCTCPFERSLQLLGHTYHIPPLCKFNPLYNEFVFLRFRALSYLTDVCGEDVSKYIC
jgi:hypothetical protein